MSTERSAKAVFESAGPDAAEPRDLIACQRFAVPFVAMAPADSWRLRRTAAGRLELCAPAASGGLSLELDATGGTLGRRLRSARSDQPLPRACGLHRRPASGVRIVDATAGFGRDAALLARLGCAVLAVERIPVLALWIEELARAIGAPDRLEVRAGDAAAILRELAGDWAAPDVAYLDPMFATHGRAQVKKEMQMCRLLAGPPRDLAELVDAAFRTDAGRVVVKRHPHEAPLRAGPSHTVEGERVRFDVYLRPAGRIDGANPAGANTDAQN